MEHELKVIPIDSKLNFLKRFQQSPTYEVHLDKDVTNKLGLVRGDLIEILGKRRTVAEVVSADIDDLDLEAIGLTELVRTNAQVLPEETVTITKADSKVAHKIVFAPIGKYLKKSQFLEIVAKKSFLHKPFVEGDVTYLRSKVLKYLLGSLTWLRVVKTDPDGVIIVNEDTELEISTDPITLNESSIDNIMDVNLDEDLWLKDLLDETEWMKINSLIELGLFNNLQEVISFFLHEGIKERSDIFEKSVSLMEQLKQLKNNVSVKAS